MKRATESEEVRRLSDAVLVIERKNRLSETDYAEVRRLRSELVTAEKRALIESAKPMFWPGSTASKREAFDVGDHIFESCVTLRDASEPVPRQTKKQLCSISSCADLPNRNQETSDECQRVIAWLGFEHRMIVCRDGIQWIAQRRKKGGAERP